MNRLFLLLTCLVAVIVGGCLWYIFSGPSFGTPSIDMPTDVDLGRREQGQIAVAKLRIANRGRGVLTVDRIRTNCACSGLEVLDAAGKPQMLKGFTLAPGGCMEVQCRITVSGRVGMPQVNHLLLTTNDPKRPELPLRIHVREVTGGLVASPAAVLFGEVLQGESRSMTLEIFDTVSPPREIIKVQPSHPDQFAVAFERDREAPIKPKKDNWPRLGLIKVELPAQPVNSVAGYVQIFLNDPGREPDKVPVSAEIRGRYRVLPSRVLLGEGRAELTVVCRDILGKPFACIVDQRPKEIEATVVSCPEQDRVHLRLKLLSPPVKDHADELILRFRSDNHEETMKVPLFLRK